MGGHGKSFWIKYFHVIYRTNTHPIRKESTHVIDRGAYEATHTCTHTQAHTFIHTHTHTCALAHTITLTRSMTRCGRVHSRLVCLCVVRSNTIPQLTAADIHTKVMREERRQP